MKVDETKRNGFARYSKTTAQQFQGSDIFRTQALFYIKNKMTTLYNVPFNARIRMLIRWIPTNIKINII